LVAPAGPITAGKVIILGALGVLLFEAHAAFIPVALALLFALVLSGPVEALHKRGFPRGLSAGLILVLALGAMAGTVELMWTPAQDWFAKAPQTLVIIKQKIGPAARFMNHLDELRKNAGNVGAIGHAPTGSASTSVITGESAPALILGATGTVLVGGVGFVIVTLFLLAGVRFLAGCWKFKRGRLKFTDPCAVSALARFGLRKRYFLGAFPVYPI
jgi:predicted PurR-regulated permease PerM